MIVEILIDIYLLVSSISVHFRKSMTNSGGSTIFKNMVNLIFELGATGDGECTAQSNPQNYSK